MTRTPTGLAVFLAALCIAGCNGSDDREPPPRAPAAATPAEAPPLPVTTRDPAPVVAEPAAVPVMVGGEEDLDACGGVDEAVGAAGVRSGPGDRFAVVDHLDPGAQVYACDFTPDQEWEGIVTIPRSAAESCGVSTPIAERQPYAGSCRSGWVRKDSLKVIAG